MLLLDIKNEATQLVNQGELQTARSLWIEVCEQEPTEIDNWLILSAIDEQLGFLPAALGHLKYAFHLDTKDPDIWLQAASLHWKLRHYEQAFQHVYDGLALDFYRADLRSKAAEWLTHLHKFDDAIVHYQFLKKSTQLDAESLSLAFACGYLQSDHAQLSDLLDYCEKSQLDIHQQYSLTADCISRLVLPNKYFPESKPSKSEGPSVLSFIEEIESLLRAKTEVDVRRHFDFMAHTELAMISEPEQDSSSKIKEQVLSALQFSDEHFPGVLEFGAGVGALGKQIIESRSNVTLMGLDFSEPALSIANKQSSYASLINYDQWADNASLLLAMSSCVIVRQRIEYYISRADLIDQFAKLTDKPLTVIIEVCGDSRDVKEIDAVVNRLNKQYNVSRLDNESSEGSELLVLRMSSNSELASEPAKFEEDAVEELANKLVSAQMSSLPRQDYENAIEIAKSVLERFPHSSQAQFIMGISAQHNKDYAKAIKYFRQALRVSVGYADAWFQLATVWQALGRYQSMLRAYNQCLKFAPSHTITLKNLISFFLTQGDWGRANHYLFNLLMQNPLSVQIQEYNKEIVDKLVYPQIKQANLNFLNGKDFKQAQFRTALDLKYFNRCESLLEELSEFLDEPEIRLLRVKTLDKSGLLRESMALLETLITDFPDEIKYLKTKRSLMLSNGNLQGAHEVFEQLLTRYQPADGEYQSDLFVANYYYFCSDKQIRDYHLNWGSQLSKKFQEKQPEALPPFALGDNASKKIRVGYVSGDLKMHSVAIFLYNIYKHHNKEKFEVVSYVTNVGGDAMMMKLRLFSDLWRDISRLDNEKAANLIRRDKVDILVDLSGHTGHNRLPLFCYKPAPIQGTYLGYANTTGLPEVDFRFTDEISDPTGLTDDLHSETLVRLPNGFLSYSRHFNSSSVFTSSQKNQDRQYTFVCCNNIQKVNFQVIRVFCEILKQVPESNILIKAHNFNNPDILARYQAEFESNGVGHERVHLMNALDMEDHQELYNNTKIALDPYPYSGTTTTCDALWMGVPVLTFAGTRHSSRVSASILTRVGLTDWIAASEEEYIEKAVNFVNDSKLLEEIKLSMRYKMQNSALMHPTQVCRDIELAYESLWGEWCESTVKS